MVSVSNQEYDLGFKGQGQLYVKSVKTCVLIRLNVCDDGLHKLGNLRARDGGSYMSV